MPALVDSAFDLYCYGCGASAPVAGPIACPACGDPMSLRAHADPPAALFRVRHESMWGYGPLLPITDPDAIVTLGEGATPLLRADRTAARLGFSELLLKNEAVNPVGSFKDRQLSVAASRARELGANTVVVVSSGNVACSASAYAARAGLRAVVFAHEHGGEGKLRQASAYGARVIRVSSASARAVFDLCIEVCRRLGWRHLSTAGMHEPYNVDGAKTIAYELYAQSGGDLPYWIVVPVGGGGLLGAVWRGFLDLARLGLIEAPPRLLGVQAAGCAPLVTAVRKGLSFRESLSRPWPNPKTIAGGLADDVLFDGHTALRAIRESGGAVVAVDDEAIIAAQARLARDEGILCDPSSAAGFAALDNLSRNDLVFPEAGKPGAPKAAGGRVCCIITGTGVRSPISDDTPFPRVSPSLAHLLVAIEEPA